MEIAKLKIKGMTCDHCASSIEKRFADKDGVEIADLLRDLMARS